MAGEPEPVKNDPRSRVRACMAQIQVALDQHRCVIVPTLEAEDVGSTGDRILIQSGWGVVPRRDPESV